jgi:hypothetical protein
VDYTRDKRSGSIRKVDNSNGTRVEIMICDISSYIVAMCYMLAFNEESNIILYWDEPTISLDYEEHPLHKIIETNWRENKISKIVLSCATLPTEEEIPDTMASFREKFTTKHVAEIHTIKSYDCKKTISILDKHSNVVLPHLLFLEYQEMMSSVEHCLKNKSLLRYFDLQEIVRFIKYVVVDTKKYIENRYRIENYFAEIKDITLYQIKIYYLEILTRIPRENWHEIHLYIKNTRKSWDINRTIASCQVSNELRKIKSVSIEKNTSSKLVRTTSTISSPVSATTGILITTEDAHTLTDGPTIFLAEDVDKIGKFYIQQTKIPSRIFENILHKIDANNQIQKRVDILTKTMEDRLGQDADKEKKNAKEVFDPEIKRLMASIETLRGEIKNVAMEAMYIPNTREHQQMWMKSGNIIENAFVPTIEEDVVREIMSISAIETHLKVLLLIGIGVFTHNTDNQYIEIMKRLATEQKLFIIIAGSDYIYGTNYQFAHCFLGKDLLNMSKQKIIQSIGRVGRTKIQQEYTVRFRDDALLTRLFLPNQCENIEAINMSKLLV